MTSYAVIYEPADDGSWSARAADVPAFASGDSPEDAALNLREAIALYLDVVRERGEAPPEPRSRVGTPSVPRGESREGDSNP